MSMFTQVKYGLLFYWFRQSRDEQEMRIEDEEERQEDKISRKRSDFMFMSTEEEIPKQKKQTNLITNQVVNREPLTDLAHNSMMRE